MTAYPEFKEGTLEAGFEMTIHPAPPIMKLRLYGIWPVEMAALYQARMRSLWPYVPTDGGWGTMVDILNAQIQSPKVMEMRAVIMQEAVQHGMRRVAYVTSSALNQLQVRRMGKEAGCSEVQCFTSEADAMAWLSR